MVRAAALMILLTTATPLHAQTVPGAERVVFDSRDQRDGKAVRLFGWFFKAKADAAAKAPLVVALHGCGGLYGSDKDLNPRHAQTVPGAERVVCDSRDQRDGKAVRLFGWFFKAKADAAAKAPLVVALHGCGGLYGSDRDLNARHAEMGELLRRQGYHVLFPDSFAPRGYASICAIKIGTRDLNVANRRRDVLGALAWAALRPEVDAGRIAILGWSHGGSTVLSSNNRQNKEVAGSTVQPRAAVAFYPGCSAYLKSRDGYRPNAPLLG